MNILQFLEKKINNLINVNDLDLYLERSLALNFSWLNGFLDENQNDSIKKGLRKFCFKPRKNKTDW